ncbi:hypothetical protein [Cytobacillus purgationiresistens]|uniref:Pullulanase n=1 Tax=Cytobacillus purgationiresistens TaxID=863449 RepID=A0ABU0APY0_9BACI|nr:hypothetical protein [Cytobacillus purgationiresistens]MDQ0273343.1 hypothetical protein [Cytobacillus purgationiresistens]
MTNLLEEKIYLSDNHIYEVVNVDVLMLGDEAGSLTLLNTVTIKLETYTIWDGETFFYVCLPTGNPAKDEDELEIYNVEDFNINLFKEDIVCA